MLRILELQDLATLRSLSGALNRHLQTLERQLSVEIEVCPSGLSIEGSEAQVLSCIEVLEHLLRLKENGLELDEQSIRYVTDLAVQEDLAKLVNFSSDTICVTARGKAIKSKTAGQSRYIRAIRSNDICFGIGPAGTGKTFLAVAMAVQAFRKQEVERIILTRPAVEAGEKLGFLPGDLQMKVDPYMRPLYDALFELMGAEQYMKNIERGLIEVSPLAYMRGRTLDSAFIILDEAQNTTMEQMKMFLTRLGFGSKAVITGDVTQIDLPRETRSGLSGVRHILKDVEGLSFIDLEARDVVRCGIVQRIIQAYEAQETRGRQNERRD